jgi:hypothetical protein
MVNYHTCWGSKCLHCDRCSLSTKIRCRNRLAQRENEKPRCLVPFSYHVDESIYTDCRSPSCVGPRTVIRLNGDENKRRWHRGIAASRSAPCRTPADPDCLDWTVFDLWHFESCPLTLMGLARVAIGWANFPQQGSRNIYPTRRARTFDRHFLSLSVSF